MWEYNHTGELMHYGVLGMKWGVRRGRVDKAYGRASKKLTKLSDKAEKKLAKSRAAYSKAKKKQYSFLASEKSAAKAMDKAKKKQFKAHKSVNKARKWYESMEKTFEGTDAKMSKEQIDLGRKYVNMLDLGAEINALA